VVNLSLGHHWGAHDGTDLEEQLHQTLTGPGKIIVVSAGNERTDRIHLGAWFVPGQTETVTFDVLRRPDGSEPTAAVTLWYDPQDTFDVTLITPSGQALDVPALNSTDNYQDATLDLELGRKGYTPSKLIQVQISLAFRSANVPKGLLLEGWKLRLTCRTAVIGRLDAWMNNSGFAAFRAHALIDESRTFGVPASGSGCLAVASHLSKGSWTSDGGDEKDTLAVMGRASPFSSLGPTRDGRWKPDLCSPGQYVTAALASGSELADFSQRARPSQRLVTIEGTSMAAPVITGAVALLLQRNPLLTLERVREALTASARHDAHTGPAEAPWNPAYGFGKVNIQAALAHVPQPVPVPINLLRKE
jgi:subtilisin family serine protease